MQVFNEGLLIDNGQVIVRGGNAPLYGELFMGKDFVVQAYGSGNAGIYAGRANGTLLSPSATLIDEQFLAAGGNGRNNANPYQQGGSKSAYRMQGEENHSVVAQGSRSEIAVTPLGATVQVGSFRVTGSVTANDVRAQVFDVTSGGLRSVSIGINDSGGAGFRALRIPN